MHNVRIVIGSALALALSGLSVACCFVFGTHLAPGSEGQLYGTADALKAILPLGIAAAIVSGQKGRATIGIVLFTVFSVYSFASELGLYSLSRDTAASTTTAGKEAFNLLKDERARIQARLTALGQTRPSKTVAAELAGQKQNRLWQASQDCHDATGTAARTFCTSIAKLEGEQAAAEEAESLRAKDETLAQKMGGMDLAEVLKSTDAQSEALARLTGFAPGSIKDGLAILVALLIELGSGLGLYAATAAGSSATAPTPGKEAPANPPDQEEKSPAPQKRPAQAASERPAPPQKAQDPVRAFTKTALVDKADKEITAADLYAAFTRWAELQGYEVMSPAGFGRKLTALKFNRVKRGGAVYYAGIDLAPSSRLN